MSSSSNLASGFVDIATYDKQEEKMYGGDNASVYFVMEIRKANWFTQVPVVLAKNSGNPGFGQEWSVAVSRSGDYLQQAWLRLTTPDVYLNTGAGSQFGANGRIRWTRNLMHNLIEECILSFNDIQGARFDNYHLDFWAAFTCPAGKRNGYQNMIGNIDSLISDKASGGAEPALRAATLNLPLPFFFSRDSGVALPTAALPYNDIKITFRFRDWNRLLVLDNVAAAAGTNPSAVPQVPGDISVAPTIGACNVWANYGIVTGEERGSMGNVTRDILIEQVQTAPRQTYNPVGNASPTFDIRFNHAVKALFFAARNTTHQNQWSNYTTASAIPGSSITNFYPAGQADPIQETSLIYENLHRLSAMGSDYFSLINPYYSAPVIPVEAGYHMYSYAIDLINPNPTGSTNFGKISNVSIVPVASQAAITAANGSGATGSGADYKQTFEFIITAVANNILRIAGGCAGFPVM